MIIVVGPTFAAMDGVMQSLVMETPLAPAPVRLTAKAAEMVAKAQEAENMAGSVLRVGVIGGGCSGLKYLLDFTEGGTDEDFVSTSEGIRVAVDPFSAAHLVGTEIDYVDGLSESGFKFNNPNIQRSCGCGSSFST